MRSVGIYIPTRGRTNLATLEHVTSSLPMVLVHPPGEEHDHPDCWPCDAEGIGATRQRILTQASEDIVVMIDDDMMFYKRGEGWEYDIFTPLDKIRSLDPIMDWILSVVDEYPHGGVSPRQANHGCKASFRSPHRVNNFHFFDRKRVLDLGADFTKLPVMEDFYVTLSLLRQRIPNIVTYDFCWNQRGSGAKGGCSLYRTLELQAQAAHLLHAAFPDFVTIVEKETKGSGIFAGTRTDVRIDWRGALHG